MFKLNFLGYYVGIKFIVNIYVCFCGSNRKFFIRALKIIGYLLSMQSSC